MRFSRWLVGYFGIIQFLHFITLVRAGWYYLQTGSLGFPAPPPLDGWPTSAIPFLLAMGFTDAILIIISEIFVLGFFKQKAWAMKIGLVALSGAIATALVFAVGTMPSGAWLVHPAGYGILCVLFAPFLVLFIQLIKNSNT